ncbi:MAG: glycoside hydrolase family 9 protein [Oscillospiraceae bacterium]
MNNDELDTPLPEHLEAAHRIYVNQAGFLPGDEKYAVIAFPSSYFSVVDSRGNICFSGVPLPYGEDKDSGDNICRADFTGLKTPGRYRVVCGKDCSQSFTIGEDVYQPCLDALLKAFYYQRCGCALDREYAGMWAHADCHTETAVLWENPEIRVNVTGGWHDAGDYGRYTTAAAVTLGHLFYAWKMFPEVFLAQDIDIPGKPSDMLDILIECRYELEWLLKMQRYDGAVWHKVTTMKHAPFIMPEQDSGQLFVFPVSSSATADFAAVTALASTIYRRYDAKFADWLVKCSEAAYGWLDKNPGFVGFSNPEGCDTGVYGENSDADNRFWAAAELYCATGGERFYFRMLELMGGDFSKTAMGTTSVGGFGALALLLRGRGNAAVLNTLQKLFIRQADELAKNCDSNGWGTSLTTEQYFWGSNMRLLTNGMVFLIADYLEKNSVNGEPRYRKYAAMQLNCLLGTNATGYSFVTGIGDFCVNYPHHRPAFADGVEECIPGLVSGGPNTRKEDSTAKKLLPEGTPPMKCFSDNTECYSLNEVAIYWNSPAVFLVAGLLD